MDTISGGPDHSLRNKLLAFARDLLNSDYAGHRLTFQLFAQSPPFAHLAAVYRNFDWQGPLDFAHKALDDSGSLFHAQKGSVGGHPLVSTYTIPSGFIASRGTIRVGQMVNSHREGQFTDPLTMTEARSWLDRLNGEHGQIFDAPSLGRGRALQQVRNFLDAYRDAYSLESDRIDAEWLARHIPAAALWLRPADGHISVLRSAPAALEWLAARVS